jgi:hypothetical protein
MVMVTLFAPIAVGSLIGTLAVPGGSQVESVDYVIVALVWSFGSGNTYYNSGLFVFEPLHILGYLSLTFFQIVFGVLVVRYCQDKCSRGWVDLVAIASIAFPVLVLALKIPTYIALHVLAYDGPVPIQLIIGLLLVKSHKVPGSDSPWYNGEQQTARAASEH